MYCKLQQPCYCRLIVCCLVAEQIYIFAAVVACMGQLQYFLQACTHSHDRWQPEDLSFAHALLTPYERVIAGMWRELLVTLKEATSKMFRPLLVPKCVETSGVCTWTLACQLKNWSFILQLLNTWLGFCSVWRNYQPVHPHRLSLPLDRFIEARWARDLTALSVQIKYGLSTFETWQTLGSVGHLHRPTDA